MAAKVRDGWKHGAVKDARARTHPCLVPYDGLPPDEQEKDRSAVRLIPPLLDRTGFRVQRLRGKNEG
ncbi:MAG: RyR domain-containing protein [Kiritimatiellia bacterium]